MAASDREVCHPSDDAVDIYTGSKRALVEVFSIRLLKVEQDYLKKIHGVILLKGSDRKHVIFEDRGDGKGAHLNSEGYFTLTGPKCGVEALDTVVIYPWLFNSIIQCDDSLGETLWRRSLGPHSLGTVDRFIKKGIESKIGMMRVNYAVYSDAVEALLEIVLCDLELDGLLEREKPIEVYGTVKASNDIVTHPEAKSVLFDRITSRESVSLQSDSSEIPLPLSRSMTVVPRESVLIVDVSLYLRCHAPHDICIISGSALLPTRPASSSTLEQNTLLGTRGAVKVKATWSN